jgi:hypothetical protein
MPLRAAATTAIVVLAAAIGLSLYRHLHHPPGPPLTTPAAPMQHEPQTMLWAWETPEDLATLDPTHTGVAFLSREVLLGNSLTVRPRRQPLHVAPGTWLMAVVRIETSATFTPTRELATQTAQAIAAAADQPNVRAVQVDFDATASQRSFYADVLRELRRDLTVEIPLSITALVSWCGEHSWLHALPIEEAVPMFFRMGGPTATRADAPRSQQTIAEPLCAGSVGLSTDEAWPAVRPTQRVYLFHPGPWPKDSLARLNNFSYQSLKLSP